MLTLSPVLKLEDSDSQRSRGLSRDYPEIINDQVVSRGQKKAELIQVLKAVKDELLNRVKSEVRFTATHVCLPFPRFLANRTLDILDCEKSIIASIGSCIGAASAV